MTTLQSRRGFIFPKKTKKRKTSSKLWNCASWGAVLIGPSFYRAQVADLRNCQNSPINVGAWCLSAPNLNSWVNNFSVAIKLSHGSPFFACLYDERRGANYHSNACAFFFLFVGEAFPPLSLSSPLASTRNALFQGNATSGAGRGGGKRARTASSGQLE